MAERQYLESLPVEILYHHLLPYLSRSDIFALRQVNRSFRVIFSSDDCWRKFVHYSSKYFSCDLKSRSTALGVAEILQDILQQEEGMHLWLNYFRLQEAHLHNWVSGQSLSHDIINLPLRNMAYMEEIVDDNCEHLVCFSVGETLHIWNITAQPQGFCTVNVGPHTLVRLLPCRKVLVKGEEGCIVAVHDLLPQANIGHPNFLFRFDEEVPRNERDIGRDVGNTQYSLYFRFILMNHIFIGYICHLSIPEDCILHLWNLKDNRKWYSASLAGIIHDFETFLSLNGVNMRQRWHINLFEGESPFVIVVLKHISSKIRCSQISIFDIDERHFTQIAQTSSEVVSCSMFCSKISVVEKIPYRVSVFSVPEVQAGNMEAGQEAADRDQLVLLQGRRLYQFYYNDPNYSVVLKRSKVLIRTDSKVLILMTDPIFHKLEIPVDASYKILGFLEPKILLMYDSRKNPTDTEVRVYNIFNQRLIRSWEYINTDTSRFKHYFTNLVYPSKLILNIGNTDQFIVYNF